MRGLAFAVGFLIAATSRAQTPATCDPQLVATLDLPIFGKLVARDGVAIAWWNYNTDVVVLDISNPKAPAIARTISLPSAPSRVAFDARALAVRPSSLSELWLFDLTNPGLPPTILPIVASSPVVDGNRLFNANLSTSEIDIYDIADLTAPKLLHSFAPYPQPSYFAFDVRGSLLVVGNDFYLAKAFDVSDPLAPTLLSQANFKGGCIGAPPLSPLVRGDRALVGANKSYCGEIDIFDLSDPGTPVFAGWVASPSTASYDLSDDTLAVARYESGFIPRLYDIKKSGAQLRFEWPTEQAVTWIALANNHVLLLVGPQLRVYRIDRCPADCDCSGSTDIDDFICFIKDYALKKPEADCDANALFNIDDFVCFQTLFAIGC